MSPRQVSSFRWNGSQWITFNASSNINEEKTTNETIRIATLNILADCFPWFIETVVRSSERLEWLCNGIINLNPTILGLNEVSPNVLQRLQQCPFIRENYFITECFDENADGKCVNGLLLPHGCILLSKLPFYEVFAVPFTGKRREAVIGKVQFGKDFVYFCTHHTTARQGTKNAQLRSRQIREVIDVLQPLGSPFVIMGDLNLYHQFEDAIIIDNQLIDAWAQTHFSHIHPFNDGDEGYTFDAVKNTLIPYYVPGNCRQMRLDRILFSHGFPAFAIAPCKLWANEPIQTGNYLFPSDHFGLCIDVVVTKTDNNREMISLSESDPSTNEILSRNAQNNSDELPNRLGIVRKTMAYTSHLVWLGATTLGLKQTTPD
ncbi:hypothetical protein I4U23_011703 [Adineta vaga]|nr:hypothetical protein I4U23_011703 [Adineta vaga]